MFTRSLAVVALFAVAAVAAPVPAPTEERLKEDALKLNSLTTDDAMQAKLTELLKNKESSKKLVATAAAMQADAEKGESPFKFNAAFVLGKLAHSQKDYKAAETFFSFCLASSKMLDSSSQMGRSYESLILLYWEQKKFQLVEDLAFEVLEIESPNLEFEVVKYSVAEYWIRSKARKGETDTALAKTTELMKNLNKQGVFYLEFINLKGSVQREAGRFEDALATSKEALKWLEKDKNLKADAKKRLTMNAKYVMTAIYVDMNEVEKSADILKELMKEDPENSTYPNDLGFIWADHDMKIEESETLIRKALELDEKMRAKLLKEGKIDKETAEKKNAAYLDSLGWVLYKNKKYDEAKKLLLESIKDDEEGAHMEIWDHLADVYAAQGDTKLAIETWTKALKFEDISKRDGERRKKITEKLKKAKADLKKGE